MYVGGFVVKMRLGQLRSPRFLASMNKVMGFEGVPVACSFKLRKIHKQITKELEDFDEENDKLVKQFCELEDDGRPKIVPVDDKHSSYVFKKGSKALYETEFKKLSHIEVDVPTIASKDLGTAEDRLLPEDVAQLEFIEPSEDAGDTSVQKVKAQK